MGALTELLTSKIPPHSLEAERTVLGAILLEPESLPKAVELLRPSDFYKEGHRQIFATMLALFERNDPVDLLTLSEELRRRGGLDEVGGPAALAALVEEAATAAHLTAYAGIVREKALLRELIRISTEIIGQSYEAKEDVDSLLDQAEQLVFRVSERRMEGTAIPVSSILKETFEYIERLYEKKEHVTGLPTGFPDLDRLTSGLQPSDFILIAGRPSMGKAQPLDARVKTVTGWKRMGELRMGDELASVDGRRSLVSGIFPQGARQVYRVTFSDGRSTECTGEHLWRVYYRGWREPQTLTAERVAEMLRAKRYQHRLWIDVPSGDSGHSEALPLDPWLLGALLGDGRLSGSSLMFSTSQPEMLERLLNRAGQGFAMRAAGGYDWRIVQAAGAHRIGVAGVTPHALMEGLRALGLWGIRSEEKFIPDIYVNSSRAARLELLRGLMDTDGWVERWGSTRFCSVSERLARGVAGLVRSLGGWCSVRSKSTVYTYRGEKKAGRQAFVCNIHYPDPKSMFHLTVKRSRALTVARRQWRPVFVSIEPVGVKETQCISVTHPSGLYVTDDYVVTHNTALALNIAKYVGIEFKKKVLILSLEMSKEQLVQRFLCAEARVDSSRVRNGYLESKDWARLTNAAGRLHEAPIFIDDTAALTVLEARAKARRMKAEHGLDLLVIDYLQLMRGRNPDNRQQEISEISRSLKAMAKELRVPVVGLSQLSRAVETRPTREHRPQLSDLRECVTGETLVVLADGRRVPIRDLVGTAPEVLAISPEGKIVEAKSEKVWRVGTKPVFSIRLASGRVIRATEGHRLFAARGWKRVSELAAGDRLAIARRLPEPTFPDCWPDLRVALLGQLIGDGSFLNHQPLRYTTSSEENSRVVTDAAREEFGCEVKRYEGRGTWHQLLISGNGNRWHPNGVNRWLRELGIFGQRSYEKRVPESVFRLSNSHIALLLRHLWATDGTIAPRTNSQGSHSVSYSTNSLGLAKDVAALLLRLGIVARISTAQKGSYRPTFFVAVSGVTDQRRFLEAVGAFGPRKPQARHLESLLVASRANTNVDTLPVGDFERVKGLMRAQGISQRRMAALRGTAYGGSSHFRFAPSRAVLAEYAEILEDTELHARATSDLFWDRIVTIEAGGEEEVFDLTVPGPASWLADGIVSHNSGALEQDADLILFLYRPDRYKEKSEIPPERQNLAEVIIGKQRNGPVETVELTFLPEYASFENRAAPRRQPF